MWPTVTAHCSRSSLFYKSFARLNLPLVFSTIRGRRRLPGNDRRAHNGFMFHFPFKLSSSVRQMNFQASETQRAPAPGPRGDTSRTCFHIHFGFWWDFVTKHKQINRLSDRSKQAAGEERHKHNTSALLCLTTRLWRRSGSMARNDLVTFIDLLFTQGWQNRQDS